jgi:hypothetical protein
VRIGGNDSAELYYDDQRQLTAVKRTDADPGCEAWFGLDLSGGIVVEEERAIVCRP